MADRMREGQRGSERGEHIAPLRSEPPQEREGGKNSCFTLTERACIAVRAAAKASGCRKIKGEVKSCPFACVWGPLDGLLPAIRTNYTTRTPQGPCRASGERQTLQGWQRGRP